MKSKFSKFKDITLINNYFCYTRFPKYLIVNWEKVYDRVNVAEFLLDYLEHHPHKTLVPSFELFKSLVWLNMSELYGCIEKGDWICILKLRVYLYVVTILNQSYHTKTCAFGYPLLSFVQPEELVKLVTNEDGLKIVLYEPLLKSLNS